METTDILAREASEQPDVRVGHEKVDRNLGDVPVEPTPEGWSARRAGIDAEIKEAMAGHFVSHDFLRDNCKAPNGGHTVTSASIIVNPGTTPNVVVQRSLASVEKELKEHPRRGAPHIIWYTPGALVPATLRSARENNRLVHKGLMRSASRLYLFPGLVDPDKEMVLGQEAVDFIKQQQKNTSFTYALLSAYALDITTGTVFFFFPEEVELQKAVALREASDKFLFLEPAKFRRDGNQGYTIRELLETANRSVTIYTAADDTNKGIEEQFRALGEQLLDTDAAAGPQIRTLRLVRVGDDKSNIPITGCLRSQEAHNH